MSRPERPSRDARTNRTDRMEEREVRVDDKEVRVEDREVRTEERELRTIINTPMVIGASELTGSLDELPDGDIGENTALLETSGDISFTDEDFRDRYTVSFVPQEESGYLGTFIANAPTNATRSDGIEGTVGWNFSVNDADLDFLGDGETVTQSYDVTIDDNNGHTSTVTATVTLTGTNDAPVITGGDTTGSVSEDDVLTANGSLAASDVDTNDILSWSVQGGGTGTYGSLAIDGNGNWTYTLNNESADVQNLDDGDMVTDSFTVQVSDGTAIVTEIVTVNISGADQNYSFETGDFTDWTTLGSAAVTSGGVGATDGSNFARLTASGATDAQIEAFLGVSSGSIDAITTGNATDGAAIKLDDIFLTAGQTVSFDWQFQNAEGSATYQDNSFFTNLNGVVQKLADFNTVGANGSSGWQTTSVTVTSTGTYDFGFGVVNEQDTAVDSTLNVDNLVII